MNRLKQLLLIFFALLASQFSIAQDIDMSHFEALSPRNIGPAGMSGRVTSIDVDPTDETRIFAGTASGGLWLSENGGISWKPVFDDAPVQSIGSVAIDPTNSSVIWVGTGEGNPRNSHNAGEGIFKSIDGGRTWKRMGLEKTKLIHRILVNPAHPNTVYVGTLGSAWGTNPERGVYKTTDGGKTWKQILYVDETTGCADLVIDPNNPNKLVAAMWEYGRKPWTFNSGGMSSGLYTSFDGGENWTKRSDKDGLPKGKLGRIGLAIAPSKSNIVYALIESEENNGFYKSTDGGLKWKFVSKTGNRPFYYNDIFVDPSNENRIFSLHSVVSKSEDGGKSFDVILPFIWNGGVHPDHHAFWVSPTNPDYMIEGNDGGLNISRDRGKTWRFVENLPLAQFYHINYDMEIPYNVMGGMQDNGSWVGPSTIWKNGGIKNEDWQEVFFGDGFDVVPKPNDNRYVYAMAQGGALAFCDRETGRSRTIAPVHPEGVRLRYNWNAGIAQDPYKDCGVYYGSQFLHYSTDCGQSWTLLSPDLTTNDPEKQKQGESGGLTLDVTDAENFTSIIAIAPSPVDKKVIWVGTDDGNLQLTRDGGKTWNNLASKLSGANAGSWIPQIVVSDKKAGEAFIVVNDYRRNDWRPMAYHTTDFGATFKRIASENQVSGHVISIVQDPVAENLLFLGTDYGMYWSIDKGKNWAQWTEGFPAVSTADLKIHPRDHDLIIGTFGRAAWIMDDIRPLRALAQIGKSMMNESFKAFPSPVAYQATYRSVEGMRFIADGKFQGPNRPGGAMMTLWFNSKKEKSAKAEEKDSAEAKKKKNSKEKEEEDSEKDEKPKGPKDQKLKVEVLNQSGITIRTFHRKVKTDTGFVRLSWNMRHDGVRYPSWNTPKKDADKPSGKMVMPGTYKVRFTWGDFMDSTSVEVKQDPRLIIRESDLKAKSDAYDTYNEMVETASQAFTELKEAQKALKLVDGKLNHAEDSTKDDMKEMTQDVKKQLDSLQHLFMDKQNTRGYTDGYENLNSYLSRYGQYLNTADGAPGQMAQFNAVAAKAKMEETLEAINTFMTGDWAEYRSAVEALPDHTFKDFEPIKLD